MFTFVGILLTGNLTDIVVILIYSYIIWLVINEAFIAINMAVDWWMEL